MSAVSTSVTLINVFSVEPHNQHELVHLLQENTRTVITTLKGWIATDLIAGADGRQVIIHSKWDAPADIEAMRVDPRMVAYFPRIAGLASLSSTIGTTVSSHHR